MNGVAVSGDFLGAATMLGSVGLIMLFGFDGAFYSLGWLVGFVTVLFFAGERQRNAGPLHDRRRADPAASGEADPLRRRGHDAADLAALDGHPAAPGGGAALRAAQRARRHRARRGAGGRGLTPARFRA